MRIVYVAPFIPYPPTDGGSIRVWQTLQGLHRRNDVHLVIQDDAPDDEHLAPVRSLVQSVTFVPHRRRSGGTGRRAAVIDAMRYPPAFLRRYRSRELVERIGPLINADGGADWLLCDTQLSGQLALHTHLPQVRRALCLYDLYDTYFRHKVDATPPGPYKAKFTLDRLKARTCERAIMRRFELISVVSPQDQRLVAAQAPASRVVLVPSGVDIAYFSPREQAQASERGTQGTQATATAAQILFVSNLAYEPNEDAVRYFLHDIWPLIRRQQSDARFVAAGKHPPEWLTALAEQDDALEVTGMVEDVRPLYHRARVVVASLRLGAGTKLKILEALAMGVPVVSTPQGCAGLHVRDGQHLLIGTTPEHFAARVVEVLRDAHLARRLATEGRALVEREYGWPAIMATFERELRESMSARPAPAAFVPEVRR